MKVRHDGVKAYLDGELVSSWQTDYSDVEQRPWWRLQSDKALGLASAGVAAEFRAIRVTEVSGKGKLLRTPMPLPFRTANQSIDDPKKWTIKLNSMHTMSDDHLRCEGNALISFDEDIPANCRISFNLNILSGPSPRIYFDGAGICMANQARSHAIVVQDATSVAKPLKNLKGDPISYKPGEVLHCAIEFRGGHFELTAGDQAISGDCQRAAKLRLEFRGSTGDSKSATDISALRFEPVRDPSTSPQ